MKNIHDLRDAFDTIQAAARDGKRACNGFETLEASCVLDHDMLASILLSVEEQLRLIADHANRSLGQTAIRID